MLGLATLRLSALILGCGLVAAAPAPPALGDPSATWVGHLRVEGGPPIPVSLYLNMVAPPFVSGLLTVRPTFLVGCPVCPSSCPPWTGIVTGKFDDGAYVLSMQFPTKDLLTCDVVCMSTIDVVLDFQPDGSMSGTGYTNECSPLLPDTTSTWRLMPKGP
jgi:hypothetical protein